MSVGSRVLARYHDGVWYQGKVVAEPDSVPPSPTAGTTEAAKAGSMSVQFDGFEDEGNVCVSADTSNLAPLNECGEVDSTAAGGTTRTTGGGGSAASASDSGDESSELEDAWADAPDLVGPDEVFFRERVLGDRGEGGRSRDGAGGGREGGPRDEVYVVGDWEQHTKGFGSRMMSRMGYRRGEGLGKEKQVIYMVWCGVGRCGERNRAILVLPLVLGWYVALRRKIAPPKGELMCVFPCFHDY